ncbi:non-ribosomal peptide synthetase, partial [bacterium]
AEIEGLIGFFVNVLALRSSLGGSPSFRELLGRVREGALEAYAHQDVPFEMLVEEVAPERDLSRTPLFQVLLVLQNATFGTLDLPGLTLEPLASPSGTAKYDLTAAFAETGRGIAGAFEYDRDLFDEASVDRFAARFQALLAAAVAAPESAIRDLAWMPEAERWQVLVEWSDGGALAPAQGCLHHAFELQAARTPEAPALLWRRDVLTYGELDRRSARLAALLRSLGVGPEVRVGILAERTPEMVVGLLGVLRAGGAYVPLDPAYPAERVAFMLEDGGAAVLLTAERLLDRLPEARPSHVLCLDRLEDETWGEAPAGPGAGPDNLAYVIYTSGSTGRPKGVAIRHRSAAGLLTWARTVFPPADLAAVLASTSICFDLSIFELFLPLAVGGRIVLAENALELPALPAAGEVTLVNTVPSAMAELVRSGALPSAVRTVNLAGEPLRRDLVERIYRGSAGSAVTGVYNLYGPSEDTTYSTYGCEEQGDPRAPSIGRPVAGTRAYVLDPAREPVAVGVAGELFLGGEGLARG